MHQVVVSVVESLRAHESFWLKANAIAELRTWGVDPVVTPDASPRLSEPKNEGWSERLKAKLSLASPADVDAEVAGLLKAAWDRS